MNKVRLTFEKGEKVKFISHLDLMRLFYRAVNRSRLPIKYSEGFNPHPILSIAFPLPVGTVGKKEYIDIELVEQLSIEEILEKIRKHLPMGIKVLKGVYVKNSNKEDFLNKVKYSKYSVEVLCNLIPDNIYNEIEYFLNKEKIVVEKRTKKGMKMTDIKSDIHRLEIKKLEPHKLVLSLILTTSKQKTLKPQLVIKALSEYISNLDIDYSKIMREELMTKI